MISHLHFHVSTLLRYNKLNLYIVSPTGYMDHKTTSPLYVIISILQNCNVVFYCQLNNISSSLVSKE